MKKLEAIIRPGTLGAVKDALVTLGLEEITVSEVKRCGPGEGRTACYRGAEYFPDSPRMKVEVVLDDQLAERAARIVELSSGIGKRADTPILLLPVDQVVGSWATQRDLELHGQRAAVPKKLIPQNGAVLTFKPAESAN